MFFSRFDRKASMLPAALPVDEPRLKRVPGRPASVVKRVVNEDGSEMEVITYPALDAAGVADHYFTTRLGGVSEGYCSSMNLSFSLDKQDPSGDHARENYRRCARVLGLPLGNVTTADQVHSVNVRRLYEEDGGKGILADRDYSRVDGTVTNVPGLILNGVASDCACIYFVDPVKRAIGLSHAGWRGAVGGMARITVEKMTAEFGTDPADLVCAISPSICPDCYEVGPEVAEAMREAYAEKAESVLRDDHNGKFHFDLAGANALFLEAAGVKPENITLPDICTRCNPDMLFSHRIFGKRRGNNGAFLVLREDE